MTLCTGLGAAAQAQIVNDSCAGAANAPLFEGANPVDTTGAVPNGPASNCQRNGTYTEDAWFSFFAGAPGYYSFDNLGTAGAMADANIAIFDACPPGGGEVACGEDYTATDPHAYVVANLQPGAEYFVRVAGANGAEGPLTLNVEFGGFPFVENDFCLDATSVGLGTHVSHTLGAGPDFTTAQDCEADATYANDVWFRFQSNAAGEYTFDTLGTKGLFDTSLKLYNACPENSGTLVACNDNISPTNLLSRVTVNLATATTYWVRVSARDFTSGIFHLNIATSATITNDDCATAQTVTLGSNPATNVGSMTDDLTPSCALGGFAGDVWFVFTAASGNIHTFDTNGSFGLDDTVLTIYSECGPGGTELACDNDGGDQFRSSVGLDLDPGEDYYIRIAGFEGAMGNFLLNITDEGPGIPNDDCATAAVVALGSNSLSTLGARTGPSAGSCLGTGGFSQDAWYRFTAPSAGFYVFDTVGSSGAMSDTAVSVFASCGGAELGCNDNAPVPFGLTTSRLRVQLAASQQVRIRVAGAGGLEGPFSLEISQVIPIAGDLCTSAIALTENVPLSASNTDPSLFNDMAVAPCTFFGEDTSDVFFVFTPSSSGEYDITVTGDGSIDPVVAAVSGCPTPSYTACMDEMIGAGSSETLTVIATAGTPIMIRVAGGLEGPVGTFQIVAGAVPPGACCQGTVCSIQTRLACPGLNGSYLGNGTLCNGSCTPACDVTSAGAGAFESEPCFGPFLGEGPSANENCFTDFITPGVPVFGNFSTGSGARDIDYYAFSVISAEEVSVRLQSERPGSVAILTCPDGFLVRFARPFEACSTVVEEFGILEPGDYALWAAPESTSGLPCDSGVNDYLLTLIIGGGTPTDCEIADFNDSGTVDATDIFIFLDAWFLQNGQSGSGLTADIDASGTVDATDIFIYLDKWFANNGMTC